MMTHFHIITPTYNRLSLLKNCIASVQSQECQKYTHYIIDDSTDSLTEDWLKNRNIPNCVYIKNESNIGSNASKNKALNYISNLENIDDSWVIFLDDDDYFNKQALSELYKHIKSGSSQNSWIVSRRDLHNGDKITLGGIHERLYKYIPDYLYGKKLSGDATHCMQLKLIKNMHFPISPKNGGEWKFFLLCAHVEFIFIDRPTTLTEGYRGDGLSSKALSSKDLSKNLLEIYTEVGRLYPGESRILPLLGYIYYRSGIFQIIRLLKSIK